MYTENSAKTLASYYPVVYNGNNKITTYFRAEIPKAYRYGIQPKGIQRNPNASRVWKGKKTNQDLFESLPFAWKGFLFVSPATEPYIIYDNCRQQ